MAKIAQLGSADGRLCGILGAATARHLTLADRRAGPGRKGARFWQDSQLTFKRATRALTSLGLLVPLPSADRPTEMLLCQHALTMDMEAMPEFLTRSMANDDPRFAPMLDSYLGVAAGFGGLSTERTPFLPPPAHVEPVRALARRGYAEIVGDQYRWTDLIGPAMRQAGFWDDALRSYTTLHLEAEVAEAEAAWRSMPDTIRHRLFERQPAKVGNLVRELALRWKGGEWHPAKKDQSVTLTGQMALADRIIEIAKRKTTGK